MTNFARLCHIVFGTLVAGAFFSWPVGAWAQPSCDKYLVYFIDPQTQFVTPPTPIELNAEKVFCSKSNQIERLYRSLKTIKPIKKRSNPDDGRIKIVPDGEPDEALVLHRNGEIVYKANTYLVKRQTFKNLVDMLRLSGPQPHDSDRPGEAH